jgi:hypothetical protein
MGLVTTPRSPSLTHLSVVSRRGGAVTAHEGGGTNLCDLGGLRRCSQARYPYDAYQPLERLISRNHFSCPAARRLGKLSGS